MKMNAFFFLISVTRVANFLDGRKVFLKISIWFQGYNMFANIDLFQVMTAKSRKNIEDKFPFKVIIIRYDPQDNLIKGWHRLHKKVQI